MSRKERIEQSLAELTPAHLSVVDESHQHSVPKGAESHFNVTVVTEVFESESRISRHRRIHQLLDAELKGGLHALTLTLLTPGEWEAKGGESLASPKCASKAGDSKAG